MFKTYVTLTKRELWVSYLNYSPDAVFLYYLLIFENQQWDIPNINYGNFYQVSIIQSEDIRILEGPLCFETVGSRPNATFFSNFESPPSIEQSLLS